METVSSPAKPHPPKPPKPPERASMLSAKCKSLLATLTSLFHYAPALVSVIYGSRCRVADLALELPWSRGIRLAIVAGNMRMHRLMDRVVEDGDTVVDVGANIGYNTAYLARLAGPQGRVIAIEPAADNVAVMKRQLARNHFEEVTIHECAAGARDGARDLFLRGPLSGINSLYPDGCYGGVTGQVEVPVVRLDTLIRESVDVIKIDVEGAEIDVLRGMPRLLGNPNLRLLVEWHPALQHAAGSTAEALPEFLFAQGFTVTAAWHTHEAFLTPTSLDKVARELVAKNRSIELFARR
jgi:FkbM family methyltransferase